jgi:hypothetical protein
MSMNKTALKFVSANQLGSIRGALETYTGRPTTIEEVGHYMIKTVDSPSQKPVCRGTEIEIPLTEVNFDVVQEWKSFVQIDVEVILQLTTGFAIDGQPLPNLNTATPPQRELYKRIFTFCGYKHASDAIAEYKLKLNHHDISNSAQSNAARESYPYHRVKPDCELQNRTGTYSLWEDIEAYETSICGRYISLYELAEKLRNGDTYFPVRFPLIIPVDATLLLQSTQIFPNCAFGYLSLHVLLTPASLVLARVNPQVSIDKCTRLHSSVTDGTDYQKIFMQLPHTITANSTSNRNMFF